MLYYFYFVIIFLLSYMFITQFLSYFLYRNPFVKETISYFFSNLAFTVKNKTEK